MENNEILAKLKELLTKSVNYDRLLEETKIHHSELEKAKKRCPSAVADFDRNNMEKYIVSKIGQKPEKPAGLLKLAVPVYLAKKKEYEKSLEEYNVQYSYYQKKYYDAFAEKRKKLDEEEKAEIEQCIQVATAKFNVVKAELSSAEEEMNSDETVGPKLKNTAAISKLIEYFQEQRVDSLKEAINLYYDERHRLKLENYAREQKEILKEITESVEEAVEKAETAALRAEEAFDLAQSAMDRADEAYDLADTLDDD